MWGFVKAPLVSTLVPKVFLWGHFCMVQWGLQRISWGLIFHSSPMTPRDTLSFAQEQRSRRVQLHVGLRKCSLGEFT